MTFLHGIGDLLRQQLERVPLSAARWLLIAPLLILMFWVVQIRSTDATPQDHQSKWYEDLRIWAWVALMIQVVIYSLF